MRPEFEGEIRGILTLITTRVLHQKRFSSPGNWELEWKCTTVFSHARFSISLVSGVRFGSSLGLHRATTTLLFGRWLCSLSLSLFVFLSALCCGHTKKARVSTFHPLFRERKRGIIIIIIIKSSLRESPASSSHTHSRRRKRRTVVLSLRRCSLVLSTRPLFDRCGQQKSADELGDHPFALLSIQHLDSMLLLLLLHRLT